jgi:hypothetical protein
MRDGSPDMVFVAKGTLMGVLAYAVWRLARGLYDGLKFEAAWKYPGDR